MISFLIASLLTPIVLVACWIALSAWRARRKGSPWVINASLILVTVAALVSVIGAGQTAKHLYSASDDDGSITAPVAWYSHVAVRDLVANSGLTPSGRYPLPTGIMKVDAVKKKSHAISLVGTARISDPTDTEQLLAVILKLLPWLIATIGFASVLPVLRNASLGNAFASSSIRSLRVLGWTLLVGLVSLELIEEVLSTAVMDGHVWFGDGPLTTNPNFLSFLPGLAVLSLVAIFRAGAQASDLERATV